MYTTLIYSRPNPALKDGIARKRPATIRYLCPFNRKLGTWYSSCMCAIPDSLRSFLWFYSYIHERSLLFSFAEPGRVYRWCACGKSKDVFCDGMSSNQSDPTLALGHILNVMHPHPTSSLSFLSRLMRCRWFEADGVLYRKARDNHVLVRLPLHVNAPILWWCSLSSRGGKRRVPATIWGGRLYGQLSTERHSCCRGGGWVWVNELVRFTAYVSLP